MSAQDVPSPQRHSFVDLPLQFYGNSSATNSVLPSDSLSRIRSEPDQLRPTPILSGPAQSSQTKAFQVSSSIKKKVNSLFHVWNNQFALNIFGSKNGVLREEERRKNSKYWVIHPCSKFRIYWDLLMLCILMTNVILLPVAIAFFHEPYNIGWLIFHGFADLIFLLDIILNFWTGIIMDQSRVLLKPIEIRKFYVKHWLALDILSIFPFDYIFQGIFHTSNSVNSAMRLLRLLKLISLIRLFRVFKFLHYLTKWEELLNATKSIARVIKFVLAVLILAHWNACIQFLVPYLQEFPTDSWVSINQLQNASVGTQYSWGLFKAFSHMLCIGFGRWPPQNVTEVWVTIISMLIGASLYAMFIGHISTLIYSVTTASRSYNEKLKQVEEYMRSRKLPHEIKVRVYDYYYQRYHGRLFDEEAILLELSQALKEDIVNYNCRELVRVVPFFTEAEESFITSVLTRLKFEMFLPNEHIIKSGAIGTKMYFIQHGSVDVTSNGKIVAQLSDGAYFGEICLLMKCNRVAGVKSTTVCDLYSLSKEDFDMVLDEFPDMRTLLETVAKERLDALQVSLDLNNTPPAQVETESSSKQGRFVPLLNTIQNGSNTIDSGDMV